MKINLHSILHDTTVDGPGFRTSVYCAGCAHHCPGCHNPQTWAFDGGHSRDVEDILQEIIEDPFADVTFSGGDPFYQAQAFAHLAKRIRQCSTKTIWCYTGFLFEELLQNPIHKMLLDELDVLVDGPFIQALKDEALIFRGSSNQRLINVPKSLQENRIILYVPDHL